METFMRKYVQLMKKIEIETQAHKIFILNTLYDDLLKVPYNKWNLLKCVQPLSGKDYNT